MIVKLNPRHLPIYNASRSGGEHIHGGKIDIESWCWDKASTSRENQFFPMDIANLGCRVIGLVSAGSLNWIVLAQIQGSTSWLWKPLRGLASQKRTYQGVVFIQYYGIRTKLPVGTTRCRKIS